MSEGVLQAVEARGVRVSLVDKGTRKSPMGFENRVVGLIIEIGDGRLECSDDDLPDLIRNLTMLLQLRGDD